jgi:hypothetical protein
MTDAQSAQNIATTYDPTEIEKNGIKSGNNKVISNPQVKVNHSVS